jgi:hypothetical protein
VVVVACVCGRSSRFFIVGRLLDCHVLVGDLGGNRSWLSNWRWCRSCGHRRWRGRSSRSWRWRRSFFLLGVLQNIGDVVVRTRGIDRRRQLGRVLFGGRRWRRTGRRGGGSWRRRSSRLSRRQGSGRLRQRAHRRLCGMRAHRRVNVGNRPGSWVIFWFHILRVIVSCAG